MTIKAGDRLPNTIFRVMGPDGAKEAAAGEIFAGKKVVLIGMPGAFTPTCHNNHLPGYIEQAEAFRGKGVDLVAVTTTNDHFVMDAWSKASGGGGKVLFLADGNGEFARAMGLAFDGSGHGMGGVRSRRYSLLAEDGVVKVLNVEESPGTAAATSAANLLKAI